jgi:hypothetical protein
MPEFNLSSIPQQKTEVWRSVSVLNWMADLGDIFAI